MTIAQLQKKSSRKTRNTGPLPRPLVERFWEKVDVRNNDECWEWKACTYRHGYGKFAFSRSHPVYAHRVAYKLTHGSIPGGLFVCHACDNKKCCNPFHLFLGTQKDNMQDCKRKGRNSTPPKATPKENHKGWIDAGSIRTLYRTGQYKQVEIAQMFGITQSLVSAIVRWTDDPAV